MIRKESKGNKHYSGTSPSEVRNHWKKELYGTDEENSTESDTDTEILDNTSSKRKKDFDKKINKKPRINESYQSDIRNHITNNTDELESSVINIIDKALLNAFVLQPLYNPPTRQRLSGTLLEYESGRIENKIKNKLDRSENYTLVLDGWTDPINKSIWEFMILTSDRKEYLYHLKDLSDQHHTAEFLASKTETIISQIGAEKISAIVSDNGANVAAARSIIHKNYPSIINLRCIAHRFNLLSQDVLKSPFGERVIKLCNILCHFFRSSHIGIALLDNTIKEKAVKGGGIKPYVKTRWITTYECANSIVRLKPAFNHILEKSKSEISNNAVLTILQKRGIFDNI
ncbi:hypothetical protein RclHR1_27810001 [Rhizophagus clarus]|uniref:DUF659 domain-containing protein n=1 Tax=Rhizophagus clarus TaxID=94130 RepID=A0A2Z6R361_9GLOM|nr:hypothetical protein RclHR1_27810001 [Rhizophagus clarus]